MMFPFFLVRSSSVLVLGRRDFGPLLRIGRRRERCGRVFGRIV